MSFRWEDFIDVAQHLSKKGTDAYLRSAVSRAYYAACCTLRDRLGIGFSGRSIHQEIIDTLEISSSPDYRYCAKLLRDLRFIRNKCDYETSYSINGYNVKLAIERAKKIINLCP